MARLLGGGAVVSAQPSEGRVYSFHTCMFLSEYPFVCFSIHLSTYLFINPCIKPSIHGVDVVHVVVYIRVTMVRLDVVVLAVIDGVMVVIVVGGAIVVFVVFD